MADRFPLIANPTTKQIEELASGDNLNLQSSGIVGATTITATKFVGSLQGNATTADTLNSAGSILSGTISSSRLSGYYGISVNDANILNNAANISAGTISSARLSGKYNIGVSTADLAYSLSDAANINSGIIDAARLAGTYNINVSSAASASNLAPGLYAVNISGNAATATTAAGLTPNANVNTTGIITANSFFGSGINLAGIVTQITVGTGLTLTSSQLLGKGTVRVGIKTSIGKTIYVSYLGSDTNTGLVESDAKRTIKAAAALALPGDTIKVFPGTFVENNPITLAKDVSIQGTELRNCIITPQNPGQDLFYVNDGCHMTNLSFNGAPAVNNASVISFVPLSGVSSNRFFDAARMIRLNLDYIARESVGFLTSGFSGFAGSHRDQDAARLIDLNANFIAAEAVGFLTSTSYKNPAFIVVNSSGIATDPVNCYDDVKSILGAISYDLKAGSNKKSIGAGLSYYSNSGVLLHITGNDPNGYSVRQATIAAINYAVGIVTHVINNTNYAALPGISTYSNLTQDFSYSPILVSGGCTDVVDRIRNRAGIITNIIGNFNYAAGITTVYGVNLESQDCADDVRDIWKCVIYDITRGGNSKCVAAGKSYYDANWNLIPQILKNPEEVNQTIKTLDYSFNIARAVINNSTWGGYPVGIATSVTNALYSSVTGVTTITAINHGLSKDDAVKIVGLGFTCPSGIATLTYPTGSLGYIFNVKSVVGVNTFEVVVGQSTLPHTYVSGGIIQKYGNFQNRYTQVKDLSMQPDSNTGFNNAIDGCSNVASALRSCIGVVTSIVGFGSTSGITTTYPGNSGAGSTIPNDPSFSPGVGIIFKGPYIRNCTNFIPNSTGLKIDGFNAEPGDRDDNGVTGSMSVDSYTQYNQGGIGVSITNGGYAQLVSIFTICDDIAIYTASGGQCDITNSNSSFGNYGLYSVGVGDNKTKSIYRYTGTATTDAATRSNVVVISGVGTNRPYDGQSCYFGTLYYSINGIRVDNGGSGYTAPPIVTISSPTGPNGVTAQASATVVDGSVTAINLLTSGSQYLNAGTTVTIAGPTGAGVTATASISNYQPIYYKVSSATLPVSGISTVSFLQTLNNTVSAGTTVYFARGSLQLASTISFEHVGAGTNILTAKPALGGVVIPENKVVQLDGGSVTYTSTDQSGNFNIGDGITINQSTGQISGRDFTKALFTTMTPFILALTD